MALVTLENLRKTYHPKSAAPVCALRGVDLAIEAGEMVAIMGASGSGKSTLLHILACLDSEFEGTYRLAEEEIGKLRRKRLAALRNREVGIVLQNFGLIHDMTVFDNVALPVYLSGRRAGQKDLRARIQTLLDGLGIGDKIDTPADQLSGGQRQRTAIARVLLGEPKLILADEPTGALDKETSREIGELLVKLNGEGRTIIVATHDPDMARLCRRVVTISDGKIMPAEAQV